MSSKLLTGLFIIVFSLTVTSSMAHIINQSYIYLKVYENSVSGRFEMSIKDLNDLFDINLKFNSGIDQIAPELKRIQRYFKSHSAFSSDLGSHDLVFTTPTVINPGKGLSNFVQLNFDLPYITTVPDELRVRYDIQYGKFSNHTGLVIMEYNWKAGIHNNETLPSLFLDQDKVEGSLNMAEGSLMVGFIGMVKQGIWHIWIGIDHILFLLALILPSVLVRSSTSTLQGDKAMSTAVPLAILKPSIAAWVPVEKFRPAFIYILKIVSFFTIAHTITLGLAAFELVMLPSRLVESIIAISIALAAYHNIQPILKGKEWMIAFGFGLFHGFGFASVLSELRSGEYLGLTLFGFNLGVEFGQVVVIIILFPILFLLRKSKQYNYILIYGSMVLIFISLYWFVERAFDYDLHLGKFFYDIYKAVR